ncbi:MAG: hypothetical protein ACLF0P_07435 [Thermoanaerobaculia bacterium]
MTQELRRLGHDVATLEELGRADQGLRDDAVLALATVKTGRFSRSTDATSSGCTASDRSMPGSLPVPWTSTSRARRSGLRLQSTPRKRW